MSHTSIYFTNVDVDKIYRCLVYVDIFYQCPATSITFIDVSKFEKFYQCLRRGFSKVYPSGCDTETGLKLEDFIAPWPASLTFRTQTTLACHTTVGVVPFASHIGIELQTSDAISSTAEKTLRSCLRQPSMPPAPLIERKAPLKMKVLP